jgi:hypothetical protein
MAKPTTPSSTELELFQIAALLEASLEGGAMGKARDYLSQSRQYLLARHQTLAPRQPVNLPGGDNLLVRLMEVSLADVLAWERTGGSTAWMPSENHPFPLAALVNKLKPRGVDAGLRWPAGSSWSRQEVLSLLTHGLAAAMPIRQADLQHLNDGNEKQLARLGAMFEAQNHLTLFCQEGDDLFTADEKLRMFHQAQGVPTFTAFQKSPVWVAWMDAGALLPTTEVILSSRGKQQVLPWTTAWAQNFHHAEAIFERLDHNAYDTDGLRVDYLKNRLPKTETWAEAKALLQATPSGWNETNENGELLWQHALLKKPGWVEAMVLEPNARLRQTGQDKQGIWKSILDGWAGAVLDPQTQSVLRSTCYALPSKDTIERLATKAPLRLADRGQLFLPRKHPHASLRQTFDLTFAQHPETWVGQCDSRQAQRACVLLAWLMVGQNNVNAAGREAAAEQATLLYQAWQRAPDALTAGTVSVLWCLREYLAHAPVKLETDVSVLVGESHLPMPTDVESWACDVLNTVKRDHPTAELMKTLVARAGLMAQAEASGTARPKAPGLRF